MYKRIFREITGNISKYIALFFLTVIAVGMGVGFLMGTNSAENIYLQYLDDSMLEDGYITFDGELDDDIRDDIENLGVTVYDNLYAEGVFDGSTLRVFNERKNIDLPAAVDGNFPCGNSEIFLDRIYAKTHDLNTGDAVEFLGKNYIVSGIGSFPDYTISLEEQTQMVADRNGFGVAMLTEEGFSAISKDDITYNYSFVIRDENISEDDRKTLINDIVKTASCISLIEDYGKLTEAFDKMSNASDIEDYCGITDNKRVTPVEAKMESNKSMVIFFVGIVFVIIAYLYMIFIMNMINNECSVIGTLLALGVRKGTILISYIIPPCIVTLAGSIVGCILGSEVFYKLPLNSFNGYYSLPVTVLEFSPGILSIFVIVPVILIIVVNFFAILKKLAIKPLRLIRKDLSKKRGVTKSRLNFFSFNARFRIRIFTQSIGTYILLFIGIFLAGWLMMFGIGMSSSFNDYIEKQSEDYVSKYQYSVSDEYDDNFDADKATVGKFTYFDEVLDQSYSFTGIGIDSGSKYNSDVNTGDYGEVVITEAASKKFNKITGDTIILENSSTGIAEAYKVIDVADKNMGFAFFVTRKEMNNILKRDSNYFNYYFSDEELDIPEENLVSTITVEDMKNSGEVMMYAMQSMITMFPIIAIIVYLIMMYLMIRMVLEKNEAGISIMKIFGFTLKEINRKYVQTTSIVVVISLLAALPLQGMLMVSIWPSCIKTIPGFVDFTMGLKEYIIIVVTGLVCYILSNAFTMRRIKKVPMTIMIKNQGS